MARNSPLGRALTCRRPLHCRPCEGGRRTTCRPHWSEAQRGTWAGPRERGSRPWWVRSSVKGWTAREEGQGQSPGDFGCSTQAEEGDKGGQVAKEAGAEWGAARSPPCRRLLSVWVFSAKESWVPLGAQGWRWADWQAQTVGLLPHVRTRTHTRVSHVTPLSLRPSRTCRKG